MSQVNSKQWGDNVVLLATGVLTDPEKELTIAYLSLFVIIKWGR